MNDNLGISIAYSFLIYDMIRMRARVHVPARACVRACVENNIDTIYQFLFELTLNLF